MVNYRDFMMIISLHWVPHYNLIDLLLYYLTFGYLSIHHVFPFALFILWFGGVVDYMLGATYEQVYMAASRGGVHKLVSFSQIEKLVSFVHCKQYLPPLLETVRHLLHVCCLVRYHGFYCFYSSMEMWVRDWIFSQFSIMGLWILRMPT